MPAPFVDISSGDIRRFARKIGQNHAVLKNKITKINIISLQENDFKQDSLLYVYYVALYQKKIGGRDKLG